MHASWNDLITMIGSAILVLGGLFGLNKKFPLLTQAVQWAEKNGPTLVKDAEQVIHQIEQIGNSSGLPATAVTEGALKSEYDHLALQFHQSQLSRVALVGLHAFGDRLNDLSADQKKALSFYIASQVPNVTEAEIESALTAAQQEVDTAAKSSLFQSANAFTEAQKLMKQVHPSGMPRQG